MLTLTVVTATLGFNVLPLTLATAMLKRVAFKSYNCKG